MAFWLNDSTNENKFIRFEALFSRFDSLKSWIRLKCRYLVYTVGFSRSVVHMANSITCSRNYCKEECCIYVFFCLCSFFFHYFRIWIWFFLCFSKTVWRWNWSSFNWINKLAIQNGLFAFEIESRISESPIFISLNLIKKKNNAFSL